MSVLSKSNATATSSAALFPLCEQRIHRVSSLFGQIKAAEGDDRSWPNAVVHPLECGQASRGMRRGPRFKVRATTEALQRRFLQLEGLHLLADNQPARLSHGVN